MSLHGGQRLGLWRYKLKFSKQKKSKLHGGYIVNYTDFAEFVPVDSQQNLVLISIPSVLDTSMAPDGMHALHAYTPATEPYDLWKGLDRSSEEYAKLKEKRSQVLWKAIERVIPDMHPPFHLTCILIFI